MAVLGISFGWSLRILNYTKFNKEIILIYQYHQKKKNINIHEVLPFFSTNKEREKKKKKD